MSSGEEFMNTTQHQVCVVDGVCALYHSSIFAVFVGAGWLPSDGYSNICMICGAWLHKQTGTVTFDLAPQSKENKRFEYVLQPDKAKTVKIKGRKER